MARSPDALFGHWKASRSPLTIACDPPARCLDFNLRARRGKRPHPVAAISKEQMSTGTVKWFNDAKGFGFITQDNGGEDVFCHHTAIAAEGFRTLAEGQKVSFDVTKGPKGLQAQNVKPV